MNTPPSSDADNAFLLQAIQLAVESVGNGGGPFGAVLVSQGHVIGRGANRVTLDCDPTAHAEVQAIRMAAKAAASPHLPQTTLYASCEPCPMCLAAAHWAQIPRIVFAASQQLANHAGFADGAIAERLYGQAHPFKAEELGLCQLKMEQAQAPFLAWLAKSDRQPY